MPTKLSYKNALKKKLARYTIFDFYNNKKTIIGLAGPDISDYVSFLRSKGFSDIRIYENDRNILKLQISQLKNLGGIIINFRDIFHAPVIKDAIYDLDFNQTIAYVLPHIEKFKESKVILTVALRPYTVDSTIYQFLAARGEVKKYIDPTTREEGNIRTESGRTYVFKKYVDSGMRMLMIYSIN